MTRADRPAGDGARVEELAAQRQWVDAAALARSLVDGGANRGFVYVALARGLMRGGAADRCVAVLEHLPAEERSENRGLPLYVQALLEVGRKRDARQAAERFLVRNPGDPVLERLLSRVRPEDGPASPSDPLVCRRRAAALLAAGFTVRAVRTLRELLAAVGPDEAVSRDLTVALAKAQQEQVARRARTDEPPVRRGPG